MATAAQIEANRRNSKRSTGPVTQSGKNRSKLNALVHGCRAEILVLPTEDPGLFKDRSRTWRLSLKPRNPAEEYMVDRMASLAWKGERIDRAQMAQLSKRVHHAGVDAVNTDLEQVISLGKRLLGDIRETHASLADADMADSVTDDNAHGAPEFSDVADDPDAPHSSPANDSRRLRVDAGRVGKITHHSRPGDTLARGRSAQGRPPLGPQT